MREESEVLEDEVDRPAVGGHVGDVARRSSSSRPPLGDSNPAIMRSSVVFPQPLGPRSEKNSPRRMSSETRSTATKSPNRLLTSWIWMAVFGVHREVRSLDRKPGRDATVKQPIA